MTAKVANSTPDSGNEGFTQADEERMKRWMRDVGWSVSHCASPEDIFLIKEAQEADEDSDDDLNDL